MADSSTSPTWLADHRWPLWAALLFGAVLLAALALGALVGSRNVALVLLLAVFLNARHFGVAAGLVTAAAGALAFAYFLVEPLYSPSIASTADQLRVLMFAVVGGLASLLTGRNRRQEQALQRSREGLRLFERFFTHSAEAKLILDPGLRVVTVNPAFSAITGYAADEACGRADAELVSALVPAETAAQISAALAGPERHWQGELPGRRRSGEPFPRWLSISAVPGPDGQASHYVVSFTDLSEQQARMRQIEQLAHFDDLSGLPNRRRLLTLLDDAVRAAGPAARPFVVLCVGLDRFKTVNDSLGPNAGDAVLRQAAQRLHGHGGDASIVARHGGDEFVVVLPDRAALDALPVASALLQALAAPFEVDGQALHLSASIGLAAFPTDGDDAATLLQHAAMAMHQAKQDGRNGLRYFAGEMDRAANARVQTERSLRRALERGEFVLHYQPQVRTGDDRPCGAEALVRWQHPELGLQTPQGFIQIAEDSGLIVPLGRWVLAEACRQRRTWLDQGWDGWRISVNLSARQFQQDDLADQVRAALQGSGLPAHCLELEITESVAMRQPEDTARVMRELRALGVSFAIDDFGTGYSSLSYLKLFPLDRLKLDRSFVRGVDSDANDAAICSAAVVMAHGLGLEVVAEGVETPAQQACLARMGCDALQGYLFARPLAAEHMAGWLQAHTAPAPPALVPAGP